MSNNKYASAIAIRAALEERLNRIAKEMNQDIMRLRRQIAFDRLLVRRFKHEYSSNVVLKGGYAILNSQNVLLISPDIHELFITKFVPPC